MSHVQPLITAKVTPSIISLDLIYLVWILDWKSKFFPKSFQNWGSNLFGSFFTNYVSNSSHTFKRLEL